MGAGSIVVTVTQSFSIVIVIYRGVIWSELVTELVPSASVTLGFVQMYRFQVPDGLRVVQL